jgi:thiamine biosynthesis protein ThiI
MQSPPRKIAVVHYNEVALKLGHRPMFVNRLVQNIRTALTGMPVESVRSANGRIVVELGTAVQGEVMQRLAQTPGVANVVAAERCAPDLDAVERLVLERLGTWRPQGSFRVLVKRADKSFPVKSPDIGARVGAVIARATRAPVSLKRADATVYVEVVPGAIYVSMDERIEGCGGLPVSTGGRVLLLLSGGIDSPVAGLRMMRRGCRVDAVHFHSVPYLDGTSRDKARRLCSILSRGQGSTRLSLVAFGDVQSEIVRSVPRSLRVVLYRRMMMRIAVRLAREDGDAALVTGESLGQVASQTLVNMRTIEDAAELPVLRPLVGMDKREIMAYAQAAGTLETSLITDQDCCTLFVPKHPATAASVREAREAEVGLELEAMVEDALARREREHIAPDWAAPAAPRAAEL